MSKLEIISIVKDGKFTINATKQIKKAIADLEGKKIILTIDKFKGTRSSQENRYYWGCVIPAQIDCFKERWGELFTKDMVHDWNKSNIWNTEKIDLETGEIWKVPGTSKVSISEFELRLERLRQFFFTKFEWIIALPNEQLEVDL